jgi:hypothetical protein
MPSGVRHVDEHAGPQPQPTSKRFLSSDVLLPMLFLN